MVIDKSRIIKISLYLETRDKILDTFLESIFLNSKA